VLPRHRYCQGIPAAQALYERKLLEKPFVEFEQSFADMNKPTLNHFMRPVQRVMKCVSSNYRTCAAHTHTPHTDCPRGVFAAVACSLRPPS
jgi:hypothetical protein